MESFKEFYRGLMGYHLINQETNEMHSPSEGRKLFGIVLVFHFIGPMLYIGAAGLFAILFAIIEKNWAVAVFFLFGVPLVIGLQSIFGWAIIDWDKRRILKNIAEAKPAS